MPPHPLAATLLVRRGWPWGPQPPAGEGTGAVGCGNCLGSLHGRPKEVERRRNWQRNWQRDGLGTAGDQREPVALERRYIRW